MDQPVTKPLTNARSRLVCFTMFDMNVDLQTFASQFQYMAVGRETCPTTGKEHYQGFAYATTAQRFPWWRKRLSPHHFEFCHGNLQQNEKYCSKEGQYQEFGDKPMGDGKRRDLVYVCDAIVKKRNIEEDAVENPTVFVQYHNGLTRFGIKPMGSGKRRDLADFCDALVTKKRKLTDVAVEYPQCFVQYHNGLTRLEAIMTQPYEHHCVRGVWIYGCPGSGKTHLARSYDSNPYIKAHNKWFDGYFGQSTIILDNLDTDTLGRYLKIWMDQWSCSGEIKGGTVQLRHTRFIVTSNYCIESLFTKGSFAAAIARRCEIIHLDLPYLSR